MSVSVVVVIVVVAVDAFGGVSRGIFRRMMSTLGFRQREVSYDMSMIVEKIQEPEMVRWTER